MNSTHSARFRKAKRKVGEARTKPSACLHEAFHDPHLLARMFLREYESKSIWRLQHWLGEWYRWRRMVWEVYPEGELRAELNLYIKRWFNLVAANAAEDAEKQGDDKEPRKAKPVTITLVNNALEALRSRVILSSHVEQPAWIGAKTPFPAEETANCGGILVHLPSLRERKPSPGFFSTNQLGFRFDPNAAEPVAWLEFLHQLWGNDTDLIRTLQEWFGYCLLPDTSQQKICLLVGPKRSGKGTIAKVLRALVGEASYCAPTLSSLSTQFGLQPLLGKSLAVISDARLSGRIDGAQVTENVLRLTGEDSVTVPRKFLPAVHVKLPTRIMILTNEIPRLPDNSGALASRFLALPMTKSWYDQEDHFLFDRLSNELPGIFLWAVEGLRRLRIEGRFRQPDSGKELLSEMEELGSPVISFVRECCVVQPHSQVPVERLYEVYTEWCVKNGINYSGSKQLFGRGLRAVVPTIATSQLRLAGRQVRFFRGIDLKPVRER